MMVKNSISCISRLWLHWLVLSLSLYADNFAFTRGACNTEIASSDSALDFFNNFAFGFLLQALGSQVKRMDTTGRKENNTTTIIASVLLMGRLELDSQSDMPLLSQARYSAMFSVIFA